MIKKADYVVFDPSDYIDNPIALARIKTCITQNELAKRLLARINEALNDK